MKAFTDYPFEKLGDIAGKKAPVRECEVISYDGNKYCLIEVSGIKAIIKSGYIYSIHPDEEIVTINLKKLPIKDLI